MGLTDLPKFGGAMAPLAPQGTTGLQFGRGHIAQGKFSLISSSLYLSSLEKILKMTFNNSSTFDDIFNDFVYSLFTGKTTYYIKMISRGFRTFSRAKKTVGIFHNQNS